MLAIPGPSVGWSDVPALGSQRRDVLIANVILPFLLFISTASGRQSVEQMVWDMLENIPAEPDSITAAFSRLGERIDTTYASQGFHELFQSRCRRGRCLTCPVGRRILAASPHESDKEA